MSGGPERILTFYGIGTPGRALDPGEAPYWLDAASFRAVAETVAARSDRERILITFDDGNESDLTIATPILGALGLPAVTFVLAGRLGRPGSLDGTGLRALAAAGIGVGSHGFDHVDWRRLDAAGRRREFAAARAALEAALGAPVEAAAVPFGRYDRRVLAGLRAAGFRAVYTSDGGPAGPGPVFARMTVRRDMPVAAIAAFLDGTEPLLRCLRRRAAILRRRLL